MKHKTLNLIHGLEASRRVGWAKFYSEQEKKDTEREKLKQENDKLRWLVRLLVKRIIFHVRLSNEDELVVLATEIEKSV